MKEMLAGIVGLLAALGAIYFFYRFVTSTDPTGGHMQGWIALGLAAVAFIATDKKAKPKRISRADIATPPNAI